MEVGENDQNLSEYSLAMNQSLEGYSKQDLLCNQIASVSFKGENMQRSMCCSTEDKENSLPHYSDNLDIVQLSPVAKIKVQTETKRPLDNEEVLTNYSSSKGGAVNKNLLPHGSGSNSLNRIENLPVNKENRLVMVPESYRKSINWDDCDVGNYEVDHSQNFFSNEEVLTNYSSSKGGAVNKNLLPHGGSNSLNRIENLPVNKENRWVMVTDSCRKSINWDDCDVGNYEVDHSQNFFRRRAQGQYPYDELDISNIEQSASQCSLLPLLHSSLDMGQDPQSEILEEPANVERKTQSLDETVMPLKKQPNTVFQWSTQKAVVSKTAAPKNNRAPYSDNNMPPPRAYDFKDLYEKRKQQTLHRLMQEEREKRIFHSRPVPDFSARHKQLEPKVVRHVVTLPLTPKVLKHSRETEAKRKQKLEELERQNQPLKFESREANVLKEDPFIPKKSQATIVPRPFNLHSEHRLQIRKKYDEATKLALMEKQKQEEEKRKIAEQELIKELRKRTTFKARPNPFTKK